MNKNFSMEIGKNTKTALLAFLGAFCAVSQVRANMMWPELLLTMHYYKNVWLIGVAFLIEWPAIKVVTNLSWSKSIIPLVVCNLFSAAVGAVLIPLGGYVNFIFWKIIYDKFGFASHGTGAYLQYLLYFTGAVLITSTTVF